MHQPANFTVHVGQQYRIWDNPGTERFSYDVRGRVLKKERYFYGSGESFITEYTYDDADRVSTITYPGNIAQVKYSYDTATHLKKVEAERKIGGVGGVAGTEKHANAAKLIQRYQRRFGPVGGGLTVEQSYRAGRYLGPNMNLPGSIRLDVVEGALTSPSAVFDFKFTINPNPVLSPARINSIRVNAGLGPNVPITVIHP